MRKKFLFISLSFVIFLNLLSSAKSQATQAASLLGEKTITLYDGTSGDIPDSTLLGFTAFPPDGASLTYDGSNTVLDTSITGTDTYAGWVASAATTDGFPMLDSSIGFQLNFTLQIESETHESSHRSGFSIIILDNDARGIEMSFWQNEIWVQHDDRTGGLFTHGEGVAFDTTAAAIDYQVTMIADTYTLTANGQPILTGPVRDYSAFDRFPDPYETPDFLFLGDDTTSAQARARLSFLSVTGSEPLVPTSEITSTSTALPQPTITSTPVAVITPVPSPTPMASTPLSGLCPSGWLLAVVMTGSLLMVRKFKPPASQP